MPELNFKPKFFDLGDKATFDTVHPGMWIVSKSLPERPLEIVTKKTWPGDDEPKINFWDWDPGNLVANHLMTKEEFDNGDYHLVVINLEREKDVGSG